MTGAAPAPIDPADIATLAVLGGLTPGHTSDLVHTSRGLNEYWSTMPAETGTGTPDWFVEVEPKARPGHKVTVGHTHIVAALVRLVTGAAKDGSAPVDVGDLREFLRTTAPDPSTSALHNLLAAAAEATGDRAGMDHEGLTPVDHALHRVEPDQCDDVVQTAVLGGVFHT